MAKNDDEMGPLSKASAFRTPLGILDRRRRGGSRLTGPLITAGQVPPQFEGVLPDNYVPRGQ